MGSQAVHPKLEKTGHFSFLKEQGGAFFSDWYFKTRCNLSANLKFP